MKPIIKPNCEWTKNLDGEDATQITQLINAVVQTVTKSCKENAMIESIRVLLDEPGIPTAESPRTLRIRLRTSRPQLTKKLIKLDPHFHKLEPLANYD